MNKLTCFALIVASLSFPALAQPFIITDFAIAENNGFSQGGPFMVIGALDPVEGGAMSGGHFILNGLLEIVPTTPPDPGAPLLRVSYDIHSDMLSLTWPSAANGYMLEACNELGNPGSWTKISTPPTEAGTNLQIALQPQAQRVFYRLQKSAGP